MVEPIFAVRLCLFGLALVGLWCCSYFAISIRKARTYMCRNGTCVKLTETPYARVLRIQNWQLAIPVYLLSGLVALSWLPFLIWASLLVSAVATFVSVYLAYALMFRLRVVCIVCYVAQSVNLAILGLWLWVVM